MGASQSSQMIRSIIADSRYILNATSKATYDAKVKESRKALKRMRIAQRDRAATMTELSALRQHTYKKVDGSLQQIQNTFKEQRELIEKHFDISNFKKK